MKKSFIVIAYAMIAALALAGCAGGTPAAGTQATSTPLAPVASDTAIIAEGRVVPVEDTTLSFNTSGVVSEILVKDGDSVEAGQVIARLAGNEQFEASISAAQLEILMAEQEMAGLEENVGLERAQLMLAVAEARKELDKATKRMASKEYQYGSSDQVALARSHYVMAEKAVEDATAVYDMFDDRSEDDPDRAETFAQLMAAKANRDKALANLNYMLAKPNEMEVATVEAQLAVAEAKLADVEARLAKVQDGPDAAQVALVQAKLANAQTRVKAASASLTDLELKAPYAGVVGKVQITAGQFVQPGVAVARLADQSAWLVETTDLTELNITRIQPGMPAYVRFDALPGVELIGRVQYIENFGENRQGDIIYTVVLRLENPDPNLRWNMSAVVTFIEDES